MLLAEQVKVWRKAERARLIAERTAQSLERRRTVRQRVQELLVGEVPSLRTAMIGFYWPFRAEVDLVRLVRELSGGGSGAALPVVVAEAPAARVLALGTRHGDAAGHLGHPGAGGGRAGAA